MVIHKELWLSSGDALAGWWRQALRHYNEATEIATRRSLSH